MHLLRSVTLSFRKGPACLPELSVGRGEVVRASRTCLATKRNLMAPEYLSCASVPNPMRISWITHWSARDRAPHVYRGLRPSVPKRYERAYPRLRDFALTGLVRLDRNAPVPDSKKAIS